MKRCFCFLVLVLFAGTVFSQKVYFMYLQSENEQPFFVKMGETISSSSSSGYLILSKLRDTTYSFTVGFPQNKWPDQEFRIELGGRDHGFLLKNFPEKGWGLFDLQTMAVHMALNAGAKPTSKTEYQEVSEFTSILSKASNDPSLREKPVAVKKEEKPVEAEPAVAIRQESNPVVPPAPQEEKPVIADSTVVAKEEIKEQPVVEKEIVVKKPGAKKEEPVIAHETEAEKKPVKTEEVPVKKEVVTETIAQKKAPPPPPPPVEMEEVVEKKPEEKKDALSYTPSSVRKKSESSTTEGFGLSFIDEYPDGTKDTINLVIPNPPRRLNNRSSSVVKEEKGDKKFLDISTDPKAEEGKDMTEGIDSAGKKVARNDCSSTASENDFLKLRRKMAGENSDEGMLDEAGKYFRSKCFTVEQIRNLGALFLNDAGKYKFYDSAYTHSSDPEHFEALQSELSDPYYINRFQAMLKQ